MAKTTPSKKTPRYFTQIILLFLCGLNIHSTFAAVKKMPIKNQSNATEQADSDKPQSEAPSNRATQTAAETNFEQNITYVEAHMGSVTLSPLILSNCFRQNGTLSILAVETTISLARIHIGKDKNSAQTGSRPDDDEKADTKSVNQKEVFKQQEGVDSNEEYVSNMTIGNNTESSENKSVNGSNTEFTDSSMANETNEHKRNHNIEDENDERYSNDKKPHVLSVGSSCTLRLTVPEMTFSKVEVSDTDLVVCAGAGSILESEVRQDMVKYCGDAMFYVNAGEDGGVSLLMKVKDNYKDDDWLSVKVSGGVMMMSLPSSFAGFIQPTVMVQPPHESSAHWVMLKIPPLHKFMLSFQQYTDRFPQRLVCDSSTILPFVVYLGSLASLTQNVSILQDRTTLRSRNWTIWNENASGRDENMTSNFLRKLDCGRDTVFPKVISANILLLEYTSSMKTSAVNPESGVVRMVYSIHKESEIPEKMSNGKWDCSVPYWYKFQHHFPCDLEAQCQKGEDEATCFYSTKACGYGYISSNGRCYFTVNLHDEMTWLKANDACAARDGYLVSLNSPEETNDVRTLLMFRPWWSLAFVGLQTAGTNLPSMYRHSWMWSDGTVANYVTMTPQTDMTCGAFRSAGPGNTFPSTLTSVHCTTPYPAEILCEMDRESSPQGSLASDQLPQLSHLSMSDWRRRQGEMMRRLIKCPKGHLTHSFLACDVPSVCFAEDYVACPSPLTSLPPMYKCACANERIPYSLVCDHRSDCQDNSDEKFCVFEPCKGPRWFRCSSQEQCVPRRSQCDGQRQCMDGSDEGSQCETPLLLPSHTPPPPLFLRMDHAAKLIVDLNSSRQLANGSLSCPQTHFTCSRSSGDCLPIFLRCNQVHDCPGSEDEADCREYACPGFFRCRDSSVCLHPDHVCDGLYQCPQQDDEAFCFVPCPAGCSCYGLALKCRVGFDVWRYVGVRYLDGDGSGMSLANLTMSWYLVHLSLSRCEMRKVYVAHLPNLLVLDLSENVLKVIPEDSFSHMENLRSLSLAGNPLTLSAESSSSSSARLLNLRTLDLSRIYVTELDDDMLTSAGGVNLEVLNLSDSRVERVRGAFNKLTKLRVLDLRGCPMTHFPSSVFKTLHRLQKVYAENYKLCCRGVLPFGFDASDCQAPENQLSSCDSLLKSNYYRLFVYLFATLSLMGNLLCMGYRMCVNRRDSTQTASVFVSNLSVANFFMGLYLLIVAAADWGYRGSYVLSDDRWRYGSACQMAGFLFVMSNEVSVFLICLMTADRYLVLRYPLSIFNFKKWTAHAASLMVWLAGFILASVPLYPSLSVWEFYSQTGLCVPLPVSVRNFPGHGYCFFLFNVVKLMLFGCIGPAQGMIYASIRSTRYAIIADKSKKSMDIIVARRLVAIVMTDFLSWFPIGLLGMLNVTGLTVTAEVQVILALFVLPLNSALNPFLYTLSMMRDLKKSRTREKIREDVLSQARHARMQANETRAVTFATPV